MNAVEIEAAISDLALQPFDAAEFPFAFLAAFGNKETTLKRLRARQHQHFGCPRRRAPAQQHPHRRLRSRRRSATTLAALRASPATAKAKAKFILATDGQTLEAEDLVERRDRRLRLSELPDHFGFFLPLAGISTVKADQGEPYRRPRHRPAEQALRRTAEAKTPTGTRRSPPSRHEPLHGAADLLLLRRRHRYLRRRRPVHRAPRADERARRLATLHEVIGELFRAMDTKLTDARKPRACPLGGSLPLRQRRPVLRQHRRAALHAIARTYLLHVGELDWKTDQSRHLRLDDPGGRRRRGTRRLGMHYTSVPNILKV